MSRRQLLRLAHSGLLDGLPLSSILGSQSPSRTIHDSSSTATVVNRNPLSNSIAKKPPQSSSSSSQGTVQRRHTSFWTHSYPHTAKPAPPNTSSSSTSIPYAPPSPDALASPASSSSSGTSAAPTLNQSASTTSGRSIWGLRTGGYQYGDNVTVAGHGQNVHVLGSHDPEPSVDLEPLASIVGAAEEEGMAGSAGTPLGAGAGRRRERKHRYLDSLMDKAGEMNLRCSVLDADGEWTLQEGRFKKAELCKEYDLDPRDLRKLDSLAPNLVPIILTRRTCILISILHVRALIKPDKVIIFDIPGVEESEAQRRFKLHLERNVKAGRAAGNEGDARVLLGLQGAGGDLEVKAQTGQAIEDGRRSEKSGAGMRMEEGEEEDADVLPYEHRALESILVATANALEEEMVYTRSLVRHLLADLEDDINRENLKRLLHYSRRMVGFQSRARYVKRSVDEILDNDEDLSAMYLTSTSLGRPRALHDHEQLELLLESFTKQVEEIVSEIDNTVANIQSTQEIAELMLDSGRNTLLALDIKISFATLGAGCAAVVAGVFGMNLTSTLESSPYAFLVTTASAGFFGLFIFIYGLRHLRRVRRVALSDRPRSKRGSVSPTWDHLPSVDPLTGASRYIDADLIRRTRASDKRKIWDMISRSKSSSASAGGLDGSTRSPADTPEMGAWKAKQALARMVGRGQAKGREGANPVWMNAKADHAGARDAWLVALAREKEGDGRGQEGWCAGQRGDRVGQWDAGPWKWGRGRAKWNKE